MSRQKILFVFGTRPETIKLFPVIRLARLQPEHFQVRLCFTGQHREMVEPLLELFEMRPENDLALMQKDQRLSELTARLLVGLDEVLVRERPNWVVVQGDTTTALAGAMSAFYRGISVAHVEAGLRTGDLSAPFPEEMNRQMLARVARLHLAPTNLARGQLLAEGVPERNIHVTGNTVVDALLHVQKEFLAGFDLAAALPGIDLSKRILLITGHRRENFGQPLRNICLAIRDVLEEYPDILAVYPVHLNPNVRGPVFDILSSQAGMGRICLIEPLDYVPFVGLMQHCHIVLTDSGGIQEEAPSLGKPVLVMREKTERPEGIEAGTVKLVGTGRQRIRDNVAELLDNPSIYQRMARAVNPYGDGKASERIIKVLLDDCLYRR